VLARRGDEERPRRGGAHLCFAAAGVQCSLPAAVLQLSVSLCSAVATLTAAACRSRQNGNELRVLAVLLECFWLVLWSLACCRQLKQPLLRKVLTA